MGKHTPGPWDIDDHGAGNGNCIRFEIIESTHPSGRNPVVICEIEDTSVDGYGSKRPDARQCAARDLANARLIAAAPELLAVCMEIAEHGTDDWDARMKTLRAAIAKATA